MTCAKQDDTTTLADMLAARRPHGSRSERQWIKQFLVPLGTEIDGFGNVYKRIGKPHILWSCHTDTVHSQAGRQSLVLNDGVFQTRDPNSNCLGADCTAGAWIMREMIKADVPGLYVFHRGEEHGGIGSSAVSTFTPELVDGIQAAIAFDRYGRNSIITHQAGDRCCSDAFARSLAAQLGDNYRLDDGGVFTDTANYTDLIGECTNVSVGFEHEHQRNETLDTYHLRRLLSALLEMNQGALVFDRKPGEREARLYDYSRYAYRDDDNDAKAPAWDDLSGDDDRYTPRELARLVRDYPDEVADWLEQYGITPEEILREIGRYQ